MKSIAVSTKCSALYAAFAQMQTKGILNNLTDAEKMITAFGGDISQRNTIEFDFELSGKFYEERLYEYIIPQTCGTDTTFYVDKYLGFECGNRLDPRYKKIITHLHLSQKQAQKALLH
ncbi:MAG: hypothetical protein ACI9TY_000943 [Alphaproteobacteria bacterium]|jgi:hypothetical protein